MQPTLLVQSRVTGLNSPGSQYQLALVPRTAGLTVDDVQYVGLGLPEGLAALANGAVDSAFTFEPFRTRHKDTNGAVPLITQEQVTPGLQGGGHQFRIAAPAGSRPGQPLIVA